MASRKLCYTKTGLKKKPLKSGRCPQGSNRTRRNKDASTGRKGGYAAKGRRAPLNNKGSCARGSVKIKGYDVKRRKAGSKKNAPKSVKYTVKSYCRKKAKKR